jgi:glycosyltransferase involved in cell wall biosynthesis
MLAPRYAALGEWADGAALLVDCDPELSHTYAMGANHEGGVVRPSVLADALAILYHDPAEYEHCHEMGLLRVQQPIYRWENISDQFDVQLRAMIGRDDQVRDALASYEVSV